MSGLDRNEAIDAIRQEQILQLCKEIDVLDEQNERYRKALESISKNGCCDNCQEAALVAKSALSEPSEEKK